MVDVILARRHISASGIVRPCFKMYAFCAFENVDGFVVFRGAQSGDYR